MAVKLADTLQAMADFPVAMASGINIVKEDDTEKDLQQMYEDGELGGESMPMPLSANMLLVSENDETSGDLIWSQIDKSEVGSVPLICTEEEWEELDPKPVEGTEVIITDDEIDGDNLPFKFGIDANGNYGYYKVGADTVTPFKSDINAEFVATKQTLRADVADGTYTFTEDGYYAIAWGLGASYSAVFNYVGEGRIILQKTYGFTHPAGISSTVGLCIVKAKSGDKISNNSSSSCNPTIIEKITLI